MQVKHPELTKHLGQQLKPVYLIAGDETLLVEEACDQVIAAALAQGYTERSVTHVEAGFHWHDLLQDAASMSLFAEKKVIDLRVPAKKFDREASDVLRTYCDAPAADNLLLIRSPRLEGRQKNTAWYKAIDKVGAAVLIWPLAVSELPKWVRGRAKSAGVQLEDAALNLFCQRIEGNLLAAAQELQKLALANMPQPISADALLAVLEDSARFNSFDLVDAVFAGDGQRIHRMINGLQEEGTALFAVTGALVAQLRQLQSKNNRYMPEHRQRLVRTFMQRLKGTSISEVLSRIALVDQQGKGGLYGDAWLSLEMLLLRLAGHRQLTSMEQILPYLRRA